MKQVLQDYGSGEFQLVTTPRPMVRENGVLVENHYSLVSAGTERSMIEFANKNLLQKARERPDLVKQVLDKVRTDGLLETYQSVSQRLDQPVPLGYSCAGVVTDVGGEISEFTVGDRVACGGAGYASHAEVVSVPRNLVVPVPDDVSLREASFTTVGAIALQGVRRASLTPGERVGVIGLGLVGTLVVQILDAYGFPTFGMDIDSRRVDAVGVQGYAAGATIGEDDVEGAVDEFTDGVGLDAVIVAAGTDSDEPVELAGRLSRDKGTISVIGNVGMDLPRDPYFEKELDFGVSRSYGPGRYDRNYEEKGLDYPISYVRWTEERNMAEFLRLVEEGGVDVEGLVTHEFAFDDALDAYDLLLNGSGSENVTGVVLSYNTEQTYEQTVALRSSTPSPRDRIGVGLIGAGNFAEGTLLPILENLPVELVGVATASGKTAKHVGDKFDFQNATTAYEEIIEDENVDLVIVATRNNLHAEITVEALEHGKDVHVEKPLALNRDELRAVISAARDADGRLMVGYNRRFAPQAVDAKRQFEGRTTPLIVDYRVCVDPLPDDHWIRDPEVGGGRIVAEVCHFLDFLQFVTGSRPKQLTASAIEPTGSYDSQDNLNVTVKFDDGSIGSVTYTSLGSSSTPKEHVEIFGSRTTASINNYKRGRVIPLSQDKGHAAQFDALLSAIRKGEASPISLEELAWSSLVTFEVQQAISTSNLVELELETMFEEL